MDLNPRIYEAVKNSEPKEIGDILLGAITNVQNASS